LVPVPLVTTVWRMLFAVRATSSSITRSRSTWFSAFGRRLPFSSRTSV
jgi:hypothetical protein